MNIMVVWKRFFFFALFSTYSIALSISGDNDQRIEVPECIIASSAFSERAKVTSVCWSPDSSKLAATSDDGYVKIFKVEKSLSCSYTHTIHREIGKEVGNIIIDCYYHAFLI